MPDSPASDLSRQIEEFFGAGRCFLLARGRVALYAGLKALNLPPGSQVIMPGYTCMVVPSAVQYAGLKPAYADINPDTYNLDARLLEGAFPSNVSAMIVQHTYGIPCDMSALRDWATAKGLPIIEDCCHSFGTRFQGQLCGTFGTFAFMSGQWNKPFSTGLGGMLLVNDAALAEKVARSLQEEAHRPGLFRNFILAMQIFAYERLVTPRTTAKFTRLYRLFNRHGLVIGSSSQQELQGVLPNRYFATMASCQVQKGRREIARIEENIRHRCRLAAFYRPRLSEIGFAPGRFGVPEDLPLLRYPVRVANKAEVLQKAEAEKVEIGSWFEVPLHPAGTRMEDLGYCAGMCPAAESACAEVVNLPTHLKVDEATALRSLEFLRQYAHPA